MKQTKENRNEERKEGPSKKVKKIPIDNCKILQNVLKVTSTKQKKLKENEKGERKVDYLKIAVSAENSLGQKM